jgi:hypothetical protein
VLSAVQFLQVPHCHPLSALIVRAFARARTDVAQITGRYFANFISGFRIAEPTAAA